MHVCNVYQEVWMYVCMYICVYVCVCVCVMELTTNSDFQVNMFAYISNSVALGGIYIYDYNENKVCKQMMAMDVSRMHRMYVRCTCMYGAS